MIKNDKWIRERSIQDGMIYPFEPTQVREVQGQKVISYGLSSYGYDMRISNEFYIFTNQHDPTKLASLVDPKKFDINTCAQHQGDSCIIPPNSFILAFSYEHFKIPRDVIAICLGKSTYARCGLVVNVTPLEPEWEGSVTIEISNTTPLPAIVYANEGIAQLIFLGGSEECEVSYADRKGKYQNQSAEITTPRV